MFDDAGSWEGSQVISSILVVGIMLAAVGVFAWSFRRPARATDFDGWCIFAVTSVLIAGAAASSHSDRGTIGPSLLALLGLPSIAGAACLCLAIRLWQDGHREKARRIATTTAIVGLLFNLVGFALMATPFMSPRRRTARPPYCLNNMRQVGIGLHNFASSNEGRLPPPTISDPPMSWRVALLPAFDQSRLLKTYRKDLRWNVEPNASLSRLKQECYLCPDRQPQHDVLGRFYSSFALITGPETIFPPEGPLTLDEVGEGDGTSNTLLLVEACHQNIVWSEPRDLDLTPVSKNGSNKQEAPNLKSLMSWHHQGGSNVIFADGSARHLSKNIDPKVLKALTTPRNGDDTGGAGF